MTNNVPACHAFVTQTYPGLSLDKNFPTEFLNFVPLAYRWHEVGPGAMKVGTCGYGTCAVCGQNIWFSSMYHERTDVLEFEERDIASDVLAQMNTVS